MSIVKSHNRDVIKSSGEPQSKREAQVAHNRCFGDLVDRVDDVTGLPDDEVLYWDPMAKQAREPVNLKDRMCEKWKPVFNDFNEYMRRGYDIREATRQALEPRKTQKAISTGQFSLPVFFTPDVFIQDQEDTPLADMMPRSAVQMDQVDVDELTSTGSASSFSEGASNWANNDDTYSNLSYNIISYGRENDVNDIVQLAANTLRSTRALTEENQVRAIRQYEEAQLIEGKGNVDANLSGNDGSGWDGLTDLANSSGTTVDASGSKITISDVRDAIRDLRRNGANREDIVHVTDHKTFQDLQADVEDFTRYDTPADDFSFGFEALEIDNTPILESHGSPNTSSERLFTSFDMSAHYMAMLQDVTMHPLARTSPQESFATDAYGVLVSESPTRTHAIHNLA